MTWELLLALALYGVGALDFYLARRNSEYKVAIIAGAILWPVIVPIAFVLYEMSE